MITTLIEQPTDSELRKMVDELITPEMADREVEILTRILVSSSDRDDRAKERVFDVVTRHAFAKTSQFEAAYNQFIGASARQSRVNDVIETGKTV